MIPFGKAAVCQPAIANLGCCYRQALDQSRQFDCGLSFFLPAFQQSPSIGFQGIKQISEAGSKPPDRIVESRNKANPTEKTGKF